MRFKHHNGRVCEEWKGLADWRVIAAENGKPAPQDNRCLMYHNEPIDGTIINNDRGEFGMPGLGSSYPTHMPHSEIPFVPGRLFCVDDTTGTDSYTYQFPRRDLVTPEAKRILEVHVPEVLSRFLPKNRKYAKVQEVDLGAKGIFPDVNRKTGVLRDRIWDGSEAVDESTVEVIDDLIGHLLLMRDKLVEGNASSE